MNHQNRNAPPKTPSIKTKNRQAMTEHGVWVSDFLIENPMIRIVQLLSSPRQDGLLVDFFDYEQFQ